jgi:hypothetical protein
MTDHDALERSFREVTQQLEDAPIRWNRVARLARRRRILAVGALVLLATGLTVLIAGGVLAGKAAVDPDFQPPLIGARVQSVDTSTKPERSTLGDYLRDSGQSTGGLSASELDEVGYLIPIRVALRGMVGQRVRLRWRMYDARSSAPVPGRIYSQVAATFRPEVAQQATRLSVWVPYPPRPGRYFVRVSLADAQGRPLSELNSAPFLVRSVPEP